MKTLIQASTLNALMLGNFDETVSVKDFLHHADTGIGTYTGLDGEAIFEDGVAYKATADGKVVVMKPEDGVAFGTVAKFDESVPTVELRDIADIEAMKKALAPYVAGNQNIFYMIKATGEFKTMHVRSCFASQKPYPTLSEVASNQREFHFANTYGTVIAVWCPRYVNGSKAIFFSSNISMRKGLACERVPVLSVYSRGTVVAVCANGHVRSYNLIVCAYA